MVAGIVTSPISRNKPAASAVVERRTRSGSDNKKGVDRAIVLGPSRDDFSGSATAFSLMFTLKVPEQIPSFKLAAQFTRVQKISRIHRLHIRIIIDHRDHCNDYTAALRSRFERRKQIALKVMANHDQVIKSRLNEELTTFEIRDASFDG